MAKKKKSATRRILLFGGILIALLVVLGVVGKATGFLGEKDNSIEVEVVKVDMRDITQVVTASGNVQPEIEVKISSDVSGEIIALPVKEGDPIQAGALLARIKPDFYVAQAEQAEAQVLQAKASQAQRRADMLNAELEMKRQEELFKKQAVAESDYQRAMTQYEVQTAAHEAAIYSVQSAEARLKEAKENLYKTSIYAPMSGTVSKLDVELGERVVGTSQMTGTEMMRIAKLDQMEMEVDINENDVVNISIGDTARIEVDAYPERGFRGIVTEIANSARMTGAGTQEQVTNFPVKIRILDPHNVALAHAGRTSTGVASSEVPVEAQDLPYFRPGMSGTVDVYTKTVQGAVAVPIQAVTVRDFVKLAAAKAAKEARERRNKDEADDEADDEAGDEATDEASETTGQPANAPQADGAIKEDLRRVVFVMAEGKAVLREVDTGISDDTHIVIKRGLQEGDMVITGPYSAVSRDLAPDAAVKERTAPGPGGRAFAASR